MIGELRLQLEQSSSAFTLSDRKARLDFREALSHGADVVGFTEVAERHAALADACDTSGYQLLLPGEGDTALAVRGRHEVIAVGTVTVVPGEKGPAAAGGHGPRAVQMATIRPFGTREHVTVCEAHWVTKAADTGGQQLAMALDLARLIRIHAKGPRLGFWMGDTNNPDRRRDFTTLDRALRKGELTSCWDELGEWPPTHGGVRGPTLDVVGSYDPDRRVECARARVWPAENSDHRPVSAWYTVRPLGRT